jgi:hypothetical protein
MARECWAVFVFVAAEYYRTFSGFAMAAENKGLVSMIKSNHQK